MSSRSFTIRVHPKQSIQKLPVGNTILSKITPATVNLMLKRLSSQRRENVIEAYNLVRAIKDIANTNAESKLHYITVTSDYLSQCKIPYQGRILNITDDWDDIVSTPLTGEYLLQCFRADVQDKEYSDFFGERIMGRRIDLPTPTELLKPIHLYHALLFADKSRDSLIVTSLNNTVHYIYSHGQGIWLENHKQECLQKLVAIDLPAYLNEALKELAKQETYHALIISVMERCMTHNYSRAVTSFVKALLYKPEIPLKFNAQADLFPVKVGLVNLRTGEYRQRVPQDYFISASPISYHPESKSPAIEKFLDDVTLGDTNLRECLQCIAGYCLTGSTKLRKFFIFHGYGNNGKTSFMTLLQHVLGNLAIVGEKELLIKGPKASPGAPSPHIAKLMGKRLVIFNETEAGETLNEAQIKAFTSNGDRITGRNLFCDSVEFTPMFKPILVTNNTPNCSSDPALWTRLVLIPWNCHFVADPKESNERQIDEAFTEKVLNSERDMEAFLNWCIEGARKVLNGSFFLAEVAKKATARYRDEIDIVKEFLDECCLVRPDYKIKPNDLFSAYTGYCIREDMPRTLGRNKFYAEITRRYGNKVHDGKDWSYKGLRLKSA